MLNEEEQWEEQEPDISFIETLISDKRIFVNDDAKLKYKQDSDYPIRDLSKHNTFSYSLGYKQAAEILVKNPKDNDYFYDSLIFPIIYLYRHHLELFLKHMLLDLHERGNTTPAKINIYTHNIDNIWKEIKEVLETNFKEVLNKIDKQGIEAFEDFIERFSKAFPPDAFRYPLDKKGQKILENNLTLTNITYIDLNHLKENFDGIDEVLMGILMDIITYKNRNKTN